MMTTGISPLPHSSHAHPSTKFLFFNHFFFFQLNEYFLLITSLSPKFYALFSRWEDQDTQPALHLFISLFPTFKFILSKSVLLVSVHEPWPFWGSSKGHLIKFLPSLSCTKRFLLTKMTLEELLKKRKEKKKNKNIELGLEKRGYLFSAWTLTSITIHKQWNENKKNFLKSK